jgi:hypothetical protein
MVAARISGLLLCIIITTTTTTTCSSSSSYEPRPLNDQFTDKGEIITTDFDVSLTVHLSITLANDQLDAQNFNTLQSSTCFEQYLPHLQEVRLY